MGEWVKYASWSSGITAVPNVPVGSNLITRDGFATHIIMQPGEVGSVILFVPISTPVYIDGGRPNAELVLVRYSSNSSAAKITDLQLFDGEETLMAYSDLNNFGAIALAQRVVEGSPGVKWGLVVGVTVKFDGTDPSGGIFNLFGAGVEFSALIKSKSEGEKG